jgi:hypothetical protein
MPHANNNRASPLFHFIACELPHCAASNPVLALARME